MENKLTIDGMLKEGIPLGIKNALAILVNALLWILTCWIPYLNVGTTIGLTVGLVTKTGRGEKIKMTEIFNSAYRKRMAEYFISVGLISIGISVSAVFIFLPGLVMMLAWSLSLYIVQEKDVTPLEAMSQSNKLTYGNKVTMFFGWFIIIIMIGILAVFFAIILSKIIILGIILYVLLLLSCAIIITGINAYIYKILVLTA